MGMIIDQRVEILRYHICTVPGFKAIERLTIILILSSNTTNYQFQQFQTSRLRYGLKKAVIRQEQISCYHVWTFWSKLVFSTVEQISWYPYLLLNTLFLGPLYNFLRSSENRGDFFLVYIFSDNHLRNGFCVWELKKNE